MKRMKRYFWKGFNNEGKCIRTMTLTNKAPEKIEIPPYDREENIYRNFISITREDAVREIKENMKNIKLMNNTKEKCMKEFNGKISFIGRIVFSIKEESKEDVINKLFEDIEGIDFRLKNGSTINIEEINWDLIKNFRDGNLRYNNLNDLEIK